MTIQLSTQVRNARLDAVETAIGVSPKLHVYAGAQPASCAAAPTGTLLAAVDLPANWMVDAAGGQKTMSGAWADNAADASGTAGHYRILASDGATCHLQGSISGTGGGGDMVLDNVVLAAGQQFQVVAYSLTDNNG